MEQVSEKTLIEFTKIFWRGLSRDETSLVSIREELYAGSWKDLEADLRQRLKGKPVIKKLTERLRSDIRTVKKLRMFESKYGVNLNVMLK